MKETEDLKYIIDKVKGKLRDYLELKGFEISQLTNKMLCPEHEESNPSCVLYNNDTYYKCFSCLPGHQLVRALRGLIEIKDLKEGEEVLTGKGVYRKILRTMKTENNTKDTYSFVLDAVRNSNLEFTSDHKMLIIRDASSKMSYLKNASDRKGLKFDSTAKNRKSINKYKDKLEVIETKASEVQIGDYFVFPVKKEGVTPESYSNFSIRKRGMERKSPRIRSIPLSDDIAWLIGIYCAEGCKYRGGIRFTINLYRQDIADKIKRIIETNFIKMVSIRPHPESTTLDVTCSSIDLEVIFSQLFGDRCFNKHIPNEFLTYSNSFKESLFDGVMDGDGSADRETLGLTSKELISQLEEIVIDLKKPFSYTAVEEHVGNDGIKRLPVYYLYFTRENRNMFYDTINGDTYACFSVNEVVITEPHKEVYDITVEGDHSFVCEHYAVHNCSASGSIYDAAQAIEGLDISGSNFIVATRYLMDYFEDMKDISGFKVPKKDLVAESVKRATRYIFNLIRESKGNEALRLKYTTKRSWSKETCYDLGIGTVKYSEVKDLIREKMDINISDAPYDKYFMKNLFSFDKMTFTLLDYMNNPIGFSTRSTGNVLPKYVNTRDIPGVFSKGDHLFQIGLAAKQARKDGFLYIMEGNADVVTAYENGIKNATAMCGTALTDNQLKMIARLKISDIVFCTDNDIAGIATVKKFLNTYKYLESNIYVKIVTIPKGENKDESDPDYFIKKNGADAFKKLKKHTAFEWLLDNTEQTDPAKIVEELIPHIALIRANSARQDRVQLLSEITGIEESYIKDDVKAFENQEKHDLESERRIIINAAMSKARSGGEDATSILQTAIKEIEDAEENKGVADISIESAVMEMTSVYEQWFNYDPEAGLEGWSTGYTILDECLDGIPKSEAYIALPGLPHVGKSAFLLNVIVGMLMQIEDGKNKDLMVYLMTIDDAMKAVLPRIIGIICNLPMRVIKKMSKQDPETKRKIKNAWDMVTRWTKDGHLFIADASKTVNLTRGIKNMMKLREKHPDKSALFVLDNFHKCAAPKGAKDRAAWIELSATIHERTVADRFTCMSTFELNKSSHSKERPHLGDISETGSIEYDCQVIMLCHNDYYMKQGATDLKWKYGQQEYPIMEANLAKNKINEYKKTLYYKFNTSTTKMFEVLDIDQIKAEASSGSSEDEDDLEI